MSWKVMRRRVLLEAYRRSLTDTELTLAKEMEDPNHPGWRPSLRPEKPS